MHAGPEQLRERFVQRGAASFVAQLRDTKDSSDMLVSLILTKEVRFQANCLGCERLDSRQTVWVVRGWIPGKRFGL